MNERIRELAEQADNWAGTEFHRLFLNNINPNMKELFEEKFAELIIRECLDILDDEDDGSTDTKSVRIAAYCIKKNFGVEE
jgi:hypothetical protein